MTNTEIIQSIRNEIERLKTIQLKRIQEGDLVDAEPYDKNEAYNELLDFLSTLESEKPMNQEGLEDILLEFYDEYDSNVENRPLIPRIYAEKLARHFAECLASAGKTLEIKPGDEVTINGHKIVYDKDKGYVTIVKSEESVPKDLEEAADKYAEELTSEPYLQVVHKTDFIHGAKWQAEQLLKSSPLPEDTVLFNKGVEEGKRLMMEEAMEGEVMTNGFYPYEPRIVAPYPNCPYDFGDKVRVVVCKKED